MSDAHRAADRRKLHAYGLWRCAVPVPDIAAHLGRTEYYAGVLVQRGARIAEYRPRYAAEVAADLLRTPATRYDARRKPERNAAIVAARRAGRTLDSIAREHGITHQRVRQIALRDGAPARE